MVYVLTWIALMYSIRNINSNLVRQMKKQSYGVLRYDYPLFQQMKLIYAFEPQNAISEQTDKNELDIPYFEHGKNEVDTFLSSLLDLSES